MCGILYIILAEGPGVARGKKKFGKKFDFDYPMSVKKNQPIRSSRLAGYRQHKYIYICFIV